MVVVCELRVGIYYSSSVSSGIRRGAPLEKRANSIEISAPQIPFIMEKMAAVSTGQRHPDVARISCPQFMLHVFERIRMMAASSADDVPPLPGSFLVIGGNRGLGLELVRHLKKRQSNVLATTRTTNDDLEVMCRGSKPLYIS